jgi:hypothetical protein
MNEQILDLDALVPQKARVKLGGEWIEVSPPDVLAILELPALAAKFQQLQTGGATTEQSAEAVKEFKKALSTLIPNIEKYSLTTNQLFALLEFIMKIAIPEKIDQMEKAGVKLDNDQKKILSDSAKSLQSSSTSTPDTPQEAS